MKPTHHQQDFAVSMVRIQEPEVVDTRDAVDMTESEEITETEGFTSDNQVYAKVKEYAGMVRNRATTSKVPDNLPVLEANLPMEKKMSTFKVRTIYTVAMISGFIFTNIMGHFYCSILVFVLCWGIFREILRIKRNTEKDRQLPLFYFLRWYCFSACLCIGYLLWLASSFEWHTVLSTKEEGTLTHSLIQALMVFPAYVPLISYCLVIAFVIMFTLSLRKFSLRYQFQQLAWVVMTCMVVIGCCLAQIALIYRGLWWFFLTNTLVIVNDIAAYIFGVFFGKTRLIALSPKKTWEGFLGASVSTVVWGFVYTFFFSNIPQLACPEVRFHATPFQFLTELSSCAPRPYLEAFEWVLPAAFQAVGLTSVWVKPIYFHLLVLSFFAGAIAPFGGFFASGFKRAFKIKDFGDFIPGHGGFTDRFDCMLVMGSFTYVYLSTFVYANPKLEANPIDALQRFEGNWEASNGRIPMQGGVSVSEVIRVAQGLSVEDKAALVKALQGDLASIEA